MNMGEMDNYIATYRLVVVDLSLSGASRIQASKYASRQASGSKKQGSRQANASKEAGTSKREQAKANRMRQLFIRWELLVRRQNLNFCKGVQTSNNKFFNIS